MKLIPFEGLEYLDDRMFVLELRKAMPSGRAKKEKLWTLVTKRNVLGFPPTRADDFDTWDEAMDYIKHALPQTPLISLEGQVPAPLLSYDEHLAWLKARGLRGPYIHPKENEERA
jgi:hypothetical protein